MKIKETINKKIITAAIPVACLIAVGVPSTTYAYNAYNYNKYLTEGKQLINADNLDGARNSFNKALTFNSKKDLEMQENIKTIETIQKSKSTFESSVKLMEEKKYLEAIDGFKDVSEIDKLRYDDAIDKINQCRRQYISENIDRSKSEAQNKNYDSAIAILDTLIGFDSSNEEAPALKVQYENEVRIMKEEEEKRIAEEKRISDEKLALEQEKKSKETPVNTTQQKSDKNKNSQASAQKTLSQPTVSVQGDVMTINDNGKQIVVQFMQSSGFYYLNYGVSARQLEPGTPGLPLELDYKSTFKYPSGVETVQGKTAFGPYFDSPIVDLPSDSPITVTIEVTYKGKAYSFTTGFTTRNR